MQRLHGCHRGDTTTITATNNDHVASDKPVDHLTADQSIHHITIADARAYC